MTDIEQPIYALKNLPEEVVAVLFAYYSQSRESLRRNLLKLIREQDIDLEARLNTSSPEETELAEAKDKARQFHEKWVVGYGHASVAEHAVVHLAIEDVSIIASKIIEGSRLASYTEKSTRYVLFDGEKFFRAPRLMQSPHAELCEDTARYLLNAYMALAPKVVDYIKSRVPRRSSQNERAYDSACRAKAYDLWMPGNSSRRQFSMGIRVCRGSRSSSVWVSSVWKLVQGSSMNIYDGAGPMTSRCGP